MYIYLCAALGNADAAFILHGIAQKGGAQPAVRSGNAGGGGGIHSTPGGDGTAEGRAEEQEEQKEQEEQEEQEEGEEEEREQGEEEGNVLEDTEEEAMTRYLQRKLEHKLEQQLQGSAVPISRNSTISPAVPITPVPQSVLLPALETLHEASSPPSSFSEPFNHFASHPVGGRTFDDDEGGGRGGGDRHEDDLSPVSRVMRGENLELVAFLKGVLYIEFYVVHVLGH